MLCIQMNWKKTSDAQLNTWLDADENFIRNKQGDMELILRGHALSRPPPVLFKGIGLISVSRSPARSQETRVFGAHPSSPGLIFSKRCPGIVGV